MRSLKNIFIFILVATFLFYEMGVQVSPGVMTHYLMRDLQTTALGLGWVSGAYFITYTLMQIPAGLIYDRFHVRWVVFVPILLCAAGAMGFSQADDVSLAFFSRMLMGLGSAFAFIAVLVVANDLFPPKYFAFIAGMTQLLAACGALAGAGPIVASMDAVGWRMTLQYLAMIGFGLSILVFIFVRYPKPSLQQTLDFGQIKASLVAICRNRQTWLLAIYACLLWAPMATFASLWGVPFIQHVLEIPHGEAVTISSMMWFGIALGSPLLGSLSDWVGLRRWPLALSAFLGLVGMSLVVFGSHQLTPSMYAVCLFLAGAACSGQVLSFAVVKENNTYENHAAAIGFNNMGVVLAGFIFQPLTGKLINSHWKGVIIDGIPYYKTGDYRIGLAVLPIAFLVAFFIALLGIKETYCKPIETRLD